MFLTRKPDANAFRLIKSTRRHATGIGYVDPPGLKRRNFKTRLRMSTLRLIHSLARRACILNGSSEHGAVQLATLRAELVVDFCGLV